MTQRSRSHHKNRGLSPRRKAGMKALPRTITADDVRVLLVTCPTCGAGAYDHCHSRRAGRAMDTPHPDRVTRAQEQSP